MSPQLAKAVVERLPPNVRFRGNSGRDLFILSVSSGSSLGPPPALCDARTALGENAIFERVLDNLQGFAPRRRGEACARGSETLGMPGP
jgi:hypothetical protein